MLFSEIVFYVGLLFFFDVSITVFILFFSLLMVYCFYNIKQTTKSFMTFQLSTQGLVDFNVEEQWEINIKSKLSWLGCWLVLDHVSQDNKTLNGPSRKKKQKSIFIFKDSVSDKQYARLSRILLKVKQEIIYKE
jgi:hypothetical protein